MNSNVLSTVILKKGKEQSWQYGHPWIFSGAIHTVDKALTPGNLVKVFNSENHFLGIGYYHPKQSIALRMLTKKDVAIDVDFCADLFDRLLQYRQQFLKNTTTAFRLCFGESDGFPGLVIDVFKPYAVIQVNTKGVENLLDVIKEGLTKVGLTKHVVMTTPSGIQEGVKTYEVQSQRIWALENGFEIAIQIGGQKTGWFCDQRGNRQRLTDWIKKLSINSILNLFSYTGGFSLYALKVGVKDIVNVDRDAQALELFNAMAQINHLPLVENIKSDVWDYLRQETRLFDLVIVDPPAFTKEKSKKQAALKGYRDLFCMSVQRVAPKGSMAVFSCSHYIFEDDLNWILRQVYHETGRTFQTVMRFSQGFDHPVPAWFPEGRYLKGLLLKEI
ncbi:MAG: class I SAM-dependent rRNA methyltransferase [Parachlamydiales bacterium]|nr:class I SAM-dependent rRNA methyltransferase [Parachlamydiales bacterium]